MKITDYYRSEAAAEAAGIEAITELGLPRSTLKIQPNGFVGGGWVVKIVSGRIHLSSWGHGFKWDAIAGNHDVPTGYCPTFGNGQGDNPKTALLLALKAYADKLAAATEMWTTQLAPQLEKLKA